MFRVVPIADEHIEGIRAGLDSAARERRCLTFLEAPSLEESRSFLRRNIREGYPQHVALVEDKEFRGRGIGTALIRETLKRFGFVHEGVQRNAVRVDGKYENLICVALLLD